MRQSGDDMSLSPFLPLIPARKTAATFFWLVPTAREMKAKQAGVKAMKQGWSLIERLTHKIASFDFRHNKPPFGRKMSQTTHMALLVCCIIFNIRQEEQKSYQILALQTGSRTRRSSESFLRLFVRMREALFTRKQETAVERGSVVHH